MIFSNKIRSEFKIKKNIYCYLLLCNIFNIFLVKNDGSYTFIANEFVDLTLTAGVEYAKNLVDVEEYREKITVLDADFTMALPMDDLDNYVRGYIGAEATVYKDASIGVYADSDNNSKHSIKAFASYKF